MTNWNLLLLLRRQILADELERKLQRARNEMLAERFGRIERREDKNVVPE
jgi:hypothetical protein